MPIKPPPLPDAADLPEIEVDDEYDSVLSVAIESTERLTAEAEVSDTLEDISVQSFEDAPYLGPLDFNDGQEMGRHPS
ncbi:MAG: hypothetical protein ITG01_12815 [Comamonas sp.]|nr:hypothetical protein [Comamonas sp.]